MKEHLRTAIWRDIIISLRKRRFNSADGDKEEKNMTVKECYEQMGADYEGVLGRLRSEVLIKKFAKKFLDDGSFRSLKDNLAQKNGEEAFRENFPFENDSFDAIICSMSFHHYPDPQAFFDSVKRCLRPNGRLILRDVTSDNKVLVWLMNTLEMPLANICGHGDVRVPTRDVVMKCCRKVGLKVEKFEIRKGMRMHCVVRKA